MRSYTNNITLLQLPRSLLEIWAEEVVNKKDFLVLDSSGLLLTVLTLQYKQVCFAHSTSCCLTFKACCFGRRAKRFQTCSTSNEMASVFISACSALFDLNLPFTQMFLSLTTEIGCWAPTGNTLVPDLDQKPVLNCAITFHHHHCVDDDNSSQLAPSI